MQTQKQGNCLNTGLHMLSVTVSGRIPWWWTPMNSVSLASVKTLPPDFNSPDVLPVSSSAKAESVCVTNNNGENANQASGSLLIDPYTCDSFRKSLNMTTSINQLGFPHQSTGGKFRAESASSYSVNRSFSDYANVFNFTETRRTVTCTLVGLFLCTKPSLIHSQAFPSGPGELRHSAGLMAVSRNVDALTYHRWRSVAAAAAAGAMRLSAQSDMTPRHHRGKSLKVPAHSSCCREFMMSKLAPSFPQKDHTVPATANVSHLMSLPRDFSHIWIGRGTWRTFPWLESLAASQKTLRRINSSHVSLISRGLFYLIKQ